MTNKQYNGNYTFPAMPTPDGYFCSASISGVHGTDSIETILAINRIKMEVPTYPLCPKCGLLFKGKHVKDVAKNRTIISITCDHDRGQIVNFVETQHPHSRGGPTKALNL